MAILNLNINGSNKTFCFFASQFIFIPQLLELGKITENVFR